VDFDFISYWHLIDWKTELAMCWRTLLAAFLGGLVGWERERKGHPAGIRTYASVCMGSCVFGLVSAHAPGVVDTTRIAAQVVTGIGFLGVGLIIQDKGKVIGLTTAASLWAAAAVGVAVALHLALLGTLTTFILVFMLRIQQMAIWRAISPGMQRRQQMLAGKPEEKDAPEDY